MSNPGLARPNQIWVYDFVARPAAQEHRSTPANYKLLIAVGRVPNSGSTWRVAASRFGNDPYRARLLIRQRVTFARRCAERASLQTTQWWEKRTEVRRRRESETIHQPDHSHDFSVSGSLGQVYCVIVVT